MSRSIHEDLETSPDPAHGPGPDEEISRFENAKPSSSVRDDDELASDLWELQRIAPAP